MTVKEQLETDLPKFFNPDEFADQAIVEGLAEPVDGLFDPGSEGEREERSPMFTCIDATVRSVPYGAKVTIRGVTYWIEAYQPDGVGLARLILRPDTWPPPA